MNIVFSVVTVLLLAQAEPPQAAADSEGRTRAVAPYLDPAAVAVARVDLARVDMDALLKELGPLAPAPASELAAARQWVARVRQAGGRELYAVVSLADLPDLPVFVVAPLAAGVDGKTLAAALAAGQKPFEAAEQIGAAVVAGRKGTLERLRKLKPDARPELARAFAAAGDAPAQLLVVPPAHARRLLAETYPTLPKEFGSGSSAVLTRGFLWGAVALDTRPEPALRVVVQAADPDAAQALADLHRKVVNALVEATAGGDLSVKVAALAGSLKPNVAGDKLVVNVAAAQVRNVLAPLARQAAGAADRNQHMNDLKQLGLALHNYHDVHGSFPPAASFDKQGKPLLSWRVHILPFLDQEKLYKQFKLDEPWDSEHNKKLIAQMPALYGGPAGKAGAGKTRYVAPVHGLTLFTGGPKGVRLRDVLDGTSNTIALVEADDDHAVEWTKPDDLKVDPKEPAKGLRVHEGKVFLALFADGSVHALKADLDAKTLWALMTRNGGEVVNVP